MDATNDKPKEDDKYDENEEPSSPTEEGDDKLPDTENKITIVLHATGNTPIVKKRKWVVDPEKKIGYISAFLRRLLKLNSSESLFLYINRAFAPAPDYTIKTLYDCYGAEGTLEIQYCKTQAWG